MNTCAKKMAFLTALCLTESWTKNLHRGHPCCTGRADTACRRVGGRVASRGGVVAVVAEPVVLPASFFLPNTMIFLLGVSARDLSLYMCGELRRLREGAHVILGDAGFRKANFLCPLIRKEVAELTPQQQHDYKSLEFALAQSRTVVEQVFVHLKNAWVVFKKPPGSARDSQAVREGGGGNHYSGPHFIRRFVSISILFTITFPHHQSRSPFPAALTGHRGHFAVVPAQISFPPGL